MRLTFYYICPEVAVYVQSSIMNRMTFNYRRSWARNHWVARCRFGRNGRRPSSVTDRPVQNAPVRSRDHRTTDRRCRVTFVCYHCCCLHQCGCSYTPTPIYPALEDFSQDPALEDFDDKKTQSIQNHILYAIIISEIMVSWIAEHCPVISCIILPVRPKTVL